MENGEKLFMLLERESILISLVPWMAFKKIGILVTCVVHEYEGTSTLNTKIPQSVYFS